MDATVRWDPVTQNADGTAITDLSDYNVYIGTQHLVYNTHAVVAAPGTSHTFTGLSDQIQYFFAVIAEDTSGNLSASSVEVSKGPARVFWSHAPAIVWR